jgi:hypothetical protein
LSARRSPNGAWTPGIRAHQHIGRQTDHLRDLGHSRRWLLITIALLAAFLLLQVVISQPWLPKP